MEQDILFNMERMSCLECRYYMPETEWKFCPRCGTKRNQMTDTPLYIGKTSHRGYKGSRNSEQEMTVDEPEAEEREDDRNIPTSRNPIIDSRRDNSF